MLKNEGDPQNIVYLVPTIASARLTIGLRTNRTLCKALLSYMAVLQPKTMKIEELHNLMRRNVFIVVLLSDI